MTMRDHNNIAGGVLLGLLISGEVAAAILVLFYIGGANLVHARIGSAQ